MSEYRSFCFTVRPLLGIPEDSPIEKAFIDLFRKNPGFLVAEKTGSERHLHGQIFFPKGKRKYDFNRDYLVKICEKHIPEWNPSQARVLKSGTKVAYSDDFFTNYTNKPDSILLEDNYPIHNSTEYYPSKDEQDKVQARAQAKDAKFHHLKELWEDHHAELAPIPTLKSVAQFMYDIMFVSKKYSVIEDARKRTQTTKALLEYLLEDPSRAQHFMLPAETIREKEFQKILNKVQSL